MYIITNRLYDFDVIRDPKNNNKQKRLNHYQDKESETNNTDSAITKITDQKQSLNVDNRVINREDLGLAPLAEIKKILLENQNQVDNRKKSTIFSTQISNNSNDNEEQSLQLSKLNSPSTIRPLIQVDYKQKTSIYKNEEKKETILEENKDIQTENINNELINFSLNNLDSHESQECDKESEQDKKDEKIINGHGEKMNEINYNKIKFNEANQNEANFKDIGLTDNLSSITNSQVTCNSPIQNRFASKSSKLGYSHQNSNEIKQFTEKQQQKPREPQYLNKITNFVSQINSVKKKKLEQLGITDTKSFLEKEINFIAQRDRKLTLTFKFVINKITCEKYCNTRDVQLLNKAESMVEKDLDVFTILDKLKEQEKMKKLFLSDQQQALFSFFPKPFISVKAQEQVMNMEYMRQKSLKQGSQEKKIMKNAKKNLNVQKVDINSLKSVMNKFKGYSSKKKLNEYQNLYSCYEKLVHEYRTKQIISLMLNYQIYLIVLGRKNFQIRNQQNFLERK